jgi:hypothetical protein
MVSGNHLVLDLLDITAFTVFAVYFHTQHNILSFSEPLFIAIILRAEQNFYIYNHTSFQTTHYMVLMSLSSRQFMHSHCCRYCLYRIKIMKPAYGVHFLEK